MSKTIKIISTVERPGKDVYEDALTTVEKDGMFYAIIVDGRRAWHESGNARALAEACCAKSTGQAAAQFVKKWFLDYVDGKQIKRLFEPRKLLEGANRAWGAKLKEFGYDCGKPEGLPGCAATAMRIDPQTRTLEFAHVCDTKILLFNECYDYFVPTIDHMWRYDHHVLQVASYNASLLEVTLREALYEINYSKHKTLQDPIALDHTHRALENNDIQAGIGVLNGMATVFVQVGNLPLGAYEYLLLCTDGLALRTALADAGTQQYPVDWRNALLFFASHDCNLESLADEIRQQENSDPDFIKYPRFAQHCDAAGILLKL